MKHDYDTASALLGIASFALIVLIVLLLAEPGDEIPNADEVDLFPLLEAVQWDE